MGIFSSLFIMRTEKNVIKAKTDGHVEGRMQDKKKTLQAMKINRAVC